MAWVELHLWLAGAARDGSEVAPELESARRAYARSFQDDDEDALLRRTTHSLSECADDRCASAALEPEGFGTFYRRGLPIFLARGWIERATTAWVGVEASRAALGAAGPAADALFARAASDLGMTWPDRAVPVVIVSQAPPVGRRALAPVALATRGRCFARDPSEGDRDDARTHARILDCLIVHALSSAEHVEPTLAGPAHDVLIRELGRDAERAWSLLVIHSVAALMAGWQPKHRSVYRRSAEAVERDMLDWLATEWRGPVAQPHDEFAMRYARRWREVHGR